SSNLKPRVNHKRRIEGWNDVPKKYPGINFEPRQVISTMATEDAIQSTITSKASRKRDMALQRHRARESLSYMKLDNAMSSYEAKLHQPHWQRLLQHAEPPESTRAVRSLPGLQFPDEPLQHISARSMNKALTPSRRRPIQDIDSSTDLPLVRILSLSSTCGRTSESCRVGGCDVPSRLWPRWSDGNSLVITRSRSSFATTLVAASPEAWSFSAANSSYARK
ncbi:hypothetical protein PAXRUDRAFT_780081, partial [Paxillus rubicundulus Ve08.2h10]